MKNETNQEDMSFSNLLDEFEFEVPGAPKAEDTKSEEELAAEAAKKAEEEAAKGGEADDEEESEEEKAKRLADEAAAKTAAEEEEEEEEAPTGKSDSFYKNLALKYIEKGKWSDELVIEDKDGNQIPIKELKDLNEETFFLIEEAVATAEEEDRKGKFLSISDVDDRRKTLIEIIKEGGELSEIFKSEEQVQEYLNPFGNLDLDDERVQERVYLNALINYNHLDKESAEAVVKKAKEDLTLDTKVKSFVDSYTKKFDSYVEGKKQELLTKKEEERKRLVDYKKALSAEYKSYGLKDSLVRRLTDSAVKESEEGFEIDSIYDQKMKDPKEAAEIILFLNDKEAYLEAKLKEAKVEQHKKTRRVIKMLPTETKKKDTTTEQKQEENEFEFKVI